MDTEEINQMQIEDLEQARINLRNHYLKGYGITVFVMLLIALLVKNGFAYSVVIIVAGIIITKFTARNKESEYRSIFKIFFVKKSLEFIFTDVSYNPIKGMSFDKIASTQMISTGDRYHSEDYVSAKYKDIAFEQADVHIEEEHIYTDSDGHTRREYVTIFKGRWMIFDFNKTFKANIQVAQKGFVAAKTVNSLFGKKEEKYKKVKMESEEFNKRFYVRAQSEHEAFYILTPSLMEKIQKLDDQNKGKLMFCFVDNKLHIALDDRKDSFEPGSVFKKINEEEIKSKIAQDTKTITQFVDELNLDNNLFK